MEAARHLLISGRVQGVGFRAWTARTAVNLGLRGWVRNLEDGRVEAWFEGPESALQEMVSACGRGPTGAWVQAVEPGSPTPVPQGFVRFDVRMDAGRPIR